MGNIFRPGPAQKANPDIPVWQNAWISIKTEGWSEGGGRMPVPERYMLFLRACGRGAWARRGPPAGARTPLYRSPSQSVSQSVMVSRISSKPLANKQNQQISRAGKVMVSWKIMASLLATVACLEQQNHHINASTVFIFIGCTLFCFLMISLSRMF